ncbi:MAG: Unknown protein [uncultured Campylobacterales bacterium]|uniref:DUF2089 domain-containing protein n=1 Tax=uncultured Campylobacterales bacterium TaxID=352960 RepID=A0A6S6SL88_9BACT|nr:MAG: Unknown protein [uncultured Campylobacterales bacterium]
MNNCTICNSKLKIVSLQCEICETTFTGSFTLSRLSKLSNEEQKLAEELIICEGNLKNLATTLNTTYPTLKKKIILLSQNMQSLKEQDEKTVENILNQIEKKQITPQKGLKLIKELNYEL